MTHHPASFAPKEKLPLTERSRQPCALHHLVEGQRGRVEVALEIGAAERLQHVALLGRLHVLGQNREAQVLGEVGDGRDDLGVALVLHDALGNGPVELNHGEHAGF